MNDEHSTMSGLVDGIEFNCGGIDGMHYSYSSVRYSSLVSSAAAAFFDLQI